MFLLLLLIGFLGACTVTPIRPSPEKPSVPVVEKPIKTKIKSIFPKQEWTDYVAELVEERGLNNIPVIDGKEWCADGMKSVDSWVHVVAAMAKRESNFKAASTYKEGFKDQKGNWVISTGLMQISLESSRQSAYGCRDFITKQSDLINPYNNLRCSLNILELWVKRDERVGGYKLGAGRYWSVMRNASSIKKTKAILKDTCN